MSRRFRSECALCGNGPALCECHVKPLSPSTGWALFRPDGSLVDFLGDGEMTPEREEHCLCKVWDEVKPKDYEAAGIPVRTAVATARRLGYRVAAVTITPNTERAGSSGDVIGSKN